MRDRVMIDRYSRRRTDAGAITLDRRLDGIDAALVSQDKRLDRLESRINRLMGALAVLIALGSFFAPIVEAYIKAHMIGGN